MDIDELIAPGFDDMDLFRRIYDLTRELEEMDDYAEPKVQQPNPNDSLNYGDSMEASPQSSSAGRIEHLDPNAEQGEEEPPQYSDGNENYDLGTDFSFFHSRDRLDLEVDSDRVDVKTSSAVRSKAVTKKSGRVSKRGSGRVSKKEPVRKSAPEVSSSCPDEGDRRYNLRRRSVVNYYGDRTTVQTERGKAKRQSRSRTTENQVEAQMEVGESASSRLQLAVSTRVTEVDTKEDNWSVCVRTPSIASEETSSAATDMVEYSAKSIKAIRRQEMVSASMDSDGHSLTLCRKSESSFHSQVVSSSTPAIPRRWKQTDWDNFFSTFSAIAAEVHTIKNLKAKRTEACRRWLSCMRNILNRPPI